MGRYAHNEEKIVLNNLVGTIFLMRWLDWVVLSLILFIPPRAYA